MIMVWVGGLVVCLLLLSGFSVALYCYCLIADFIVIDDSKFGF